MRIKLTLLMFAGLLGLPGALAFVAPLAIAAPAAQPLESIAAAARQRLEAEAARDWRADATTVTEVHVDPLDPRLRLPACGGPLATELPPGTRKVGAVAVGVRCPAPAWSVFVPGRVSVRKPVVVTTASLPRGTVLASGDLMLEPRDLSSLPGGYLVDPSALLGKTLRRALQPRAVVLPGMAEAPTLVRRGERVTLQAGSGRIAVQVEGEALSDGALGEGVQVRNLATRRVVHGTVGGPRLVTVNVAGVAGRVNQP